MLGPSLHIVCCPRHLLPAALKQLHDALPQDQQSVLAQAVHGLDAGDEAPWEGLLIAPAASSADESGPLNGVIWVQRAAGNTAVIWAAPDDGDAAQGLLRAAAAFVDAHEIALAQMVVGDQDGYCDAVLARCGFPRFAELAYLFAETPAATAPAEDAQDDVAPAECSGLHFVPGAGDEPQRLAVLLDQTYLGTQDCPGLDGVRPMSDVLEGYRAQGRYSPGDWYFVEEHGVDVGALILAEHPGFGNWELVYMGVVPAARGRKCGERIIRFALDAVARRGAERLVLAVDEANAPALRIYQSAGFVTWDRRIVYARLRTRA